MALLYAVLKAVHLLGVVLLVGNVIVTLVWKLGADRTGEPSVIAFGQRLVTLTDWWFTLSGVVLILIGGFGAAWVAGLDPFGVHWLVWGQILFGLSGLLWALILIPAQIRQARQANRFASSGVIPAEYWRDARRWTWWGILAIVPLLGAIWIMIAKPTAVPAEPTDRLNRGKQEQIPQTWTVSTKAQLQTSRNRRKTTLIFGQLTIEHQIYSGVSPTSMLGCGLRARDPLSGPCPRRSGGRARRPTIGTIRDLARRAPTARARGC